MEFECYVVKYRDELYACRNPFKHGRFTLTGLKFNALERGDQPDTEDLENIAESLGVSVSDLSVVKRTIVESPSEPKPITEIPNGTSR